MPLHVHTAIRAAALLLVAIVGSWRWDLRPAAARPLLVIVIVITSIVWARIDLKRLEPGLAEWVWARAAAGLAVSVLIIGLVRGWQPVAAALVAGIAGTAVVVPAWAVVASDRPQDPREGLQPPVSRAAMTWVTVIGMTLLLAAPIAVLAFEALIEWNGCFISCRTPDHPAAVILAAVVGVLLIDLIVWGVAAWRRFPRLLTAAAAAPLLTCVAATYLVL